MCNTAPRVCTSVHIGVAHTVIPIQRQHSHKIKTSVYVLTTYLLYRALETGRCVSLQKTRRQGDTIIQRPRARRVAQSSQAARNCRGSKLPRAESVDQLETEIEERGVRKRGEKGYTIIQRDVKQMISSLIQAAYR